MEKKPFDALVRASEIAQAIPKGVLFTTTAAGQVNTMVIGWGHVGFVWNKPAFVAYIRTSRHSHELVEQSGEFTVNIPRGAMRKDIFAMAGRQSGRNVDKVAELGLTLVDAEAIDTPAIAECPITLECKVVYKQLLDGPLPDDVAARFYPADVIDIDAGGVYVVDEGQGAQQVGGVDVRGCDGRFEDNPS